MKDNDLYLDQDPEQLRLRIQKLETRLERIYARLNNQNAVLEVAKRLNSVQNLDDLLGIVMDRIMDLTGAERGFLMLSEADSSLSIRLARNFELKNGMSARISHSITRQVTLTGEPVWVSDAAEEDAFRDRSSVAEMALRMIACIPLKLGEKIIGVIYADSKYVTKGLTQEDTDMVEALISQAAVAIGREQQHHEELESLKGAIEEIVQNQQEKYSLPGIVASSGRMQDVLSQVDRLVQSKVDVLIRGESGTGKELIARAIHFNGPRKDKPFIPVNCAAIPETLLESELFGIEKRVATGVDRRLGKFERAHQGTLFLDEIGDMSPVLQSKLLRVLQEREFERVGGANPIKIEVRIIAATNRDLEAAIKEDLFREDLYYRLNVANIFLPPLADRREDIPLLTEHFLQKYIKEYNLSKKVMAPEVMRVLQEAEWPGNVRQLENAVASALTMSRQKVIQLSDLPYYVQVADQKNLMKTVYLPASFREHEQLEANMILKALEENDWNQSKAARSLGVNEKKIRDRMKKYKICKKIKNICILIRVVDKLSEST